MPVGFSRKPNVDKALLANGYYKQFILLLSESDQ